MFIYLEIPIYINLKFITYALETRIKYLFTKNCAQEQPVNVWYKYVLTYKYIYRKCRNTVIHVAYSYYNNGNIIISTKQSLYLFF